MMEDTMMDDTETTMEANTMITVMMIMGITKKILGSSGNAQKQV